jgi:hypothetical protein
MFWFILATALLVTTPVHATSIRYTLATENASGDIDWQIQFTRHPDLSVTDEFNRQRDSFQFYIFNSRASLDGGYQAIIRGEELHYGGDLPIRSILPVDLDFSRSGGWGLVREAVPFTLHGTHLTFTTSFASLGVPTRDFGYFWETYRYGATVEGSPMFLLCGLNERCNSTPLPDFIGCLSLLVGFAMLQWLQHSKHLTPAGRGPSVPTTGSGGNDFVESRRRDMDGYFGKGLAESCRGVEGIAIS